MAPYGPIISANRLEDISANTRLFLDRDTSTSGNSSHFVLLYLLHNKMPYSHHSHSGQFCKHATGSLEEVVLEAIRRKFKVYGLSEHVPRYRKEDLYPEEAWRLNLFRKFSLIII